jgi:hypothetical protein
VKSKLAIAAAFGGLALVALYVIERPAGTPVAAPERIVQAPVSLDSMAGDSSGTNQLQLSGKAVGEVQNLTGASQVGLTVINGKLYMITADTAGAAALSAMAATGSPPLFRCGDSQAGDTAQHFAAWALPSYSASDATQSTEDWNSADRQSGMRLACTLASGQGN